MPRFLPFSDRRTTQGHETLVTPMQNPYGFQHPKQCTLHTWHSKAAEESSCRIICKLSAKDTLLTHHEHIPDKKPRPTSFSNRSMKNCRTCRVDDGQMLLSNGVNSNRIKSSKWSKLVERSPILWLSPQRWPWPAHSQRFRKRHHLQLPDDIHQQAPVLPATSAVEPWCCSSNPPNL